MTGSPPHARTAAGNGGGILEGGLDLALTLTSVVGNTAASGGGIFATAGSPVTLKLSLVVKNTPDNCIPHGSIAGCVG
jgi:predicted outer membrane repeat protein